MRIPKIALREDQCALCRTRRPLCKSHIIPRFMYGKMFEGGVHAHVISTNSEAHPRKASDGLYEKLLCQKCETLLSGPETYARQLLYGGKEFIVPYETPFGYAFRGLDYRRFKLFQMSLLWRASVTRRPEFSRCNLNRDRRERLRRMLLAGEPGHPREFGCIMFTAPTIVDKLGECVEMPDVIRVEHRIMQRFVIGGIFWLFGIPNAHPRAVDSRIVPNRRGEMMVLINEQHANEYLRNLAFHFYRGNMHRVRW